MTIPAKAGAASGNNPSTGPWDSPALAELREWEPAWVEQCLKMSNNPGRAAYCLAKTSSLLALR